MYQEHREESFWVQVVVDLVSILGLGSLVLAFVQPLVVSFCLKINSRAFYIMRISLRYVLYGSLGLTQFKSLSRKSGDVVSERSRLRRI